MRNVDFFFFLSFKKETIFFAMPSVGLREGLLHYFSASDLLCISWTDCMWGKWPIKMFAWYLKRNACENKAFPKWYFISEMQFLDSYYSVSIWFTCLNLFFTSLNSFRTIPHLKMFSLISLINLHCKYVIHLLWLKILIDLYCASIAW